MLVLIPDHDILEIEKDYCSKIENSWFHGVLKEDSKTDLFYIQDHYGAFDFNKLIEDGVYPAICDRDYCMLYLWNTEYGPHAIAVKTTDEKANNYAKERYESKTHIL